MLDGAGRRHFAAQVLETAEERRWHIFAKHWLDEVYGAQAVFEERAPVIASQIGHRDAVPEADFRTVPDEELVRLEIEKICDAENIIKRQWDQAVGLAAVPALLALELRHRHLDHVKYPFVQNIQTAAILN
jgi:hypothetical protein